MRVTVFGLGRHGGGAAAARFFAESGCRVIVTDGADPRTLEPAAAILREYSNIEFVLGEHRAEDFYQAELVIKNPAVPWSHPMLRHARRIETDISWFLRRTERPLIAVSGTKGKTTTSMLIRHLITPQFPGADVGGNMGRSPFLFCGEASADPVVLELSSRQLQDLRILGCPPSFRIAVLTSLFPDHMDFYSSYRDYVQDKAYLFSDAAEGILPAAVLEQREFSSMPMQIRRLWTVGAHRKYGHMRQTGDRWEVYDPEGRLRWSLDETDAVWKDHAMTAALTALILGVSEQQIAEQLQTFIPPRHRLEHICSFEGIDFWDDSAATVPESVLRSVRSFSGRRVHLITGGTDKNLSPRLFREIFQHCFSVHLLAGSFTEKLLKQPPGHCSGPFSTMEAAVSSAAAAAQGEAGVILLSPGAASFEYFLNAHDRGEAFREAVGRLQDGPSASGASS